MMNVTLLELLQTNVTAFGISILANITSRYIPDNRENKKFKKEFAAAVKTGVDEFLSYFPEGNREWLKTSIDKNKVERLFGKIIEKIYSQDKDILQNLEKIISDSGVDIAKIPDFSISKAHSIFCEGFLSYARYSPELRGFLLVLQGETNIKKEYDFIFLKDKYFKYLKQEFSILDFKGLNEGRLITMPLKYLYTTLEFSKEVVSKGEKELFKTDDQKRIEVSDILKNRYSVITGDPGAGKTTFLKYIALCFVNNSFSERLKVSKPCFPVFFPIAALSRGMDKNKTIDYQFETFLSDYFKSLELYDVLPAVKEAALKGEVIYLMDGLDEVSDESRRMAIIKKIRNYIINKDEFKNKFLVTCRTASYTEGGRFKPFSSHEFKQYNVIPFKKEQIRSFLFEFYKWYYKDFKKKESCEKDAENKCSEMMNIILLNEKILEIATNPLMLTIFALIEHTGGEMPKSRAELYLKCVRLLTEKWERLRTDFERKDSEFKLGKDIKITIDFVIKYIGKIALDLHVSADKFIEKKDFVNHLADQFKNIADKKADRACEYAKDFIKILGEKSGIIEKISTDKYGFMHQTFREYLAARYLTEHTGVFEILRKRVFDPEWLEVVLLASASLSGREATKLLINMYDYDIYYEIKYLLIGRCIEDIERSKIGDEFYEKFYHSLEQIAFSDHKPLKRAMMAEVIGRIGDRRDDHKDFIEFKAQTYGFEEFKEKKKLKTFEMGKYPVTNLWYKKFIDAGGYNSDKYFTIQGKKWFKKEKPSFPRFWHERKYNCPNSPVVGVSWYEADAFCRWLTETCNNGYEYRLPTEFEWQAAAAGKEKREYPWGKGIDLNKCNYNESKIGRISPVGIFKDGKTPEQVYDMAGNAKEWACSFYDADKDSYVLRGGSFDDPGNYCRCAYRDDVYPCYREDEIVFRCARIKL